MAIERWEEVLQPALHSIRSLLCTATNATPHERLFSHARRSYNGRSLPTWLSNPGPVLMRNHVRANKYEPIVQEVELIEANPDYAHVRFPDGRETSVSIRHLAPKGETMESPRRGDVCDNRMPLSSFDYQNAKSDDELPESSTEQNPQENATSLPVSPELQTKSFRRSTAESLDGEGVLRPTRKRRQPSYLTDYVTD